MMLGRRSSVGLFIVVLAVLLLPKAKAAGLHFPVLKDLELNEAPDDEAHLLYTPAANQDRILDLVRKKSPLNQSHYSDIHNNSYYSSFYHS